MMNNKFNALQNDSGSSSEDAADSNESVPQVAITANDDISAIQMVHPGPDEHPLQYTYCFWFSKRPPGKNHDTATFEKNMKVAGTFSSVEQFWSLYTHMKRVTELPHHNDIHLFKYGIKPLWEDEANKDGGKWVVRLRKGVVARCWENLVLAILGEQFMVGDEICGAVVSIRFQEDIIAIWNRTASEQQVINRIRDTLSRVLYLPANTAMDYKKHTESIKSVHKKFTIKKFDRFLETNNQSSSAAAAGGNEATTPNSNDNNNSQQQQNSTKEEIAA